MDPIILANSSWTLSSAAVVLLMTPGVALFYTGILSNNHVLSTIIIITAAYCVVSLQWFLFGYSLVFSPDGGTFVGNFYYGALYNVVDAAAVNPVAPTIPLITHCLFQLQFATVTVAIIFGAVGGRVRIIPALVFAFLWTTLVYDFVAYWTWGNFGWLRNLNCLGQTCGEGALDFAGGGPVHIASGAAGLAFAFAVRGRKGCKTLPKHNLVNVYLGTCIIWFGWLGFNGGSALSPNTRGAMAAFVTVLASAASCITWISVEYWRHRKFSSVGLCTGIIAGLVGVTPGSGYVPPWAAFVIGSLTAIACYFACEKLNDILRVDDTLNAFACHGVGGIVGGFLTGIFAEKNVAALDGSVISGSAITGYPKQIGFQLVAITVITAWSFVVTYLIVFLLKKVMQVTYDETCETVGADSFEMTEKTYNIQGIAWPTDSDLCGNGVSTSSPSPEP